MKIVITLEVDDAYEEEILNEIVGLELKCADGSAFEYDEFTLKPIPQKKTGEILIKGNTGEIVKAYRDGWNACVESILGEEE